MKPHQVPKAVCFQLYSGGFQCKAGEPRQPALSWAEIASLVCSRVWSPFTLLQTNRTVPGSRPNSASIHVYMHKFLQSGYISSQTCTVYMGSGNVMCLDASRLNRLNHLGWAELPGDFWYKQTLLHLHIYIHLTDFSLSFLSFNKPYLIKQNKCRVTLSNTLRGSFLL